MSKHVFIIPEPHLWDKTFKNRRDYPGEISGYLSSIIETIAAFNGEKIIIFPGDIFHRGYGDINGLVAAFNLFKELNAITDGNVYSCVGNHELSYTDNNPFWILAEDQTERYDYLHGLKAFGAMRPGVKVVDSLDVGPLNFIFGHFNREDFNISSEKDIVLITHNAIAEPEIIDYMTKKYADDTRVEYMHPVGVRDGKFIPLLGNLKYVFVGHMHTYFGKFNVEETVDDVPMKYVLQYMGSIGRTSVSDINDKNLSRVIPHFVIDDNAYTYEPIAFQLKPRAEIIIERVVQENAEKYKDVQTMRNLVKQSSFGETPEQRIDRRLAESPFLLELFHAIYSNELNGTLTDLLKEAETL